MLNCIIYQIKCLETGEVYIGSTTQTLIKRMYNHKHPTNRCISRQIINRGNYKVSILLYISCKNRVDKDRIEGKFIISEPNAINKHIAGRNDKERTSDNRQKINEYSRNYHKTEKAQITRKKYYNKIQALKPTKEENKISRIWRNTWGGDPRQHNNLLKIDKSIFQS